MAVEVSLERGRYLGVTACPQSDGWVVCLLDSEGDIEPEVLHDGPAAGAVEMIGTRMVAEIAVYDEQVRANTTEAYDAVRVVAYDDDGIYGAHGEIIETAGVLGVLPPPGRGEGRGHHPAPYPAPF